MELHRRRGAAEHRPAPPGGPATAPPNVYLRLTVRDTAGNKAVAQTPDPVLIDLSVPEVSNIGLGGAGPAPAPTPGPPAMPGPVPVQGFSIDPH